jgi:hypothetical protein
LDIPITTRELQGFESTVGWLMSGLIVVATIDPEKSLTEFISNFSDLILETADHRYYSNEMILKDFDIPINILTPFQINVINNMSSAINNLNPSHSVGGTAYFDFSCNVFHYSNGFKFSTTYNSELFHAHQVENLFETLSKVTLWDTKKMNFKIKDCLKLDQPV